jgi:beta-ureidopropionase / N-carbamoyl-L-amino-acid hydrolase
MTMDLRVDPGRLRADIEKLSTFGRDAKGGVSRPSFSRADLEARAWLKDRIRDAGLAVRQDGAGNIFGRIEGPGKTVMAGSHIDTVLNGGDYDGSVGVLAALECLRRIKEESLPLARALEMASFTDEEGNLVGDFLGSRAFMGLLDRDEVTRGRTQFGRSLPEILDGTGLTVESVLAASGERPDLDAFLELHIEQGPILETEEAPIGIVEAISGKKYRWCSFTGKASHAGTTPPELRQDAFLGLADFALRGTRHAAIDHYGSMVTIGKVSVHPGVFSTVPGRAEFSLDIRSVSAETLAALEAEILDIARDIASSRGLKFASRLVDATEPVRVPPRIIGILEDECGKLGYRGMRIASGAGHDAQILAAGCDSGMIFIPCLDGISHSPDESIDWADLEKGANLLLRGLARLAG